MARRKRRSEDAVDGRLEDVLDDGAPTGGEGDSDLVEDESGAGLATRRRTASQAKRVGIGKRFTRSRDVDRVGGYARLRNFVREVVAELRKVIWPTRKELLTYTAVVIVFVTIMFSVVASLDYGFGKAMFWIFGNTKSK